MTTRTLSGIHATRVTLLFGIISGVAAWPEGTYGIPMPKTGCPSVTNFEWKTGSRTQHTEMGSHASEDIHLAGIYADPTDKITQSFCMKTIPVRDGDYSWQKGQYCIYKKGKCPAGFQDGWLYWDDAAPWFGDTIQNLSGTTPDGEYDRNTRIYFCCRNDGSATSAIELPNSSPFHLLKWGDQCQKVANMEATEEWVYWRDEDQLNLNMHGGLYPKIRRSSFPVKYTKLFYCYYTNKPETNTMQTILLILYILGGVVGSIIVILILMCIAQRFFTKSSKEYYEEHTMSSMQPETMMTSSIGRQNGPVGTRPPPSSGSGVGGATNGGGRRDPPYAPFRPNGTASSGHHPQRHPTGGGKQKPAQHKYDVKYAPAAVGAMAGRAPPAHGRGAGGNGNSGANNRGQNPGAFAMPPRGDIVESPGEPADLATESTPMLGPPAMPVTSAGNLPPAAPLPGATPVPMLGPPAMPRPPSYKETPEPGTVSIGSSGFHTPSEAGSPAGSATVSPAHTPGTDPGLMGVIIPGMRPISEPPSYEDVLREDHRGVPGSRGPGRGGKRGPANPGAMATLGCLGDDDHFESRYSDSD